MKPHILITLALLAAAPVHAGTSVGISIGIQQPGVYGRIDIGNYPQPEVVYAEPMLIAPSRVARYQQPIYLYVPDVYQRDWGRYCGRYSACGQPVYFVQERWVRERYQQEHPRLRGDRDGRSHGHEGHGRRSDERRHPHGHDNRDSR